MAPAPAPVSPRLVLGPLPREGAMEQAEALSSTFPDHRGGSRGTLDPLPRAAPPIKCFKGHISHWEHKGSYDPCVSRVRYCAKGNLDCGSWEMCDSSSEGDCCVRDQRCECGARGDRTCVVVAWQPPAARPHAPASRPQTNPRHTLLTFPRAPPLGTLKRGQVVAMVVVVALVSATSQALPTLDSTALPAPTFAPTTLPDTTTVPPTKPLTQDSLRREVQACCGARAGLRPVNVTVERTSPTSVSVSWERPAITPLKYEITYRPTNAKYRVVAEVVAPLTRVELRRLLPLTQYEVWVATVVNDTALWSSPPVTFLTTTLDDRHTHHGSSTGWVVASPTAGAGAQGTRQVRAEEVSIILLVLAVWMFAIALFFNRWGKIRMLEPYQEPYKEAPPLQHRPSCPMADLPLHPLKVEHLGARRLRQNSVFVGRPRSHSVEVHPPRRVKSALNLTTLVLQESEEEDGGAAART